MTHNASARPRVRDDVVFRELDQEWVVFDPATRRLHALNATAALVWEHCGGDLTVAEVVEAVRSAFSQPPAAEVVRRDVEEILERFRAEGLLA
jgi:PqqD family protein of HPr-rel-A system